MRKIINRKVTEISLNTAILHGKEYRKNYRGTKAVDRDCRNHGACIFCRENRLHQRRLAEFSAKEQLDFYFLEKHADIKSLI